MTGSVYAGRRIALLTQHGKEAVIAPVLDGALGCRVERVSGFDTDTLGTFTRDIPRAGNQLEAARRKARIGMELSGLPLGLASEGAFGPDPMAGLFPWNVELLLFIDDVRGIEVTGMAQQATRFSHLLTDDWGAAAQFAREAGFPEHHLVVRSQGQDDLRVEKDIATWAALEAAFHRARGQAENGQVFLEHDLRAHAHPTRRDVISLAAVDLAAKLDSRCPVCGTPGFWIAERLAGLPCADCGAPTREVRATIHGCLKCGHRDTRERVDAEHADPGRCDYCNP
ncbi:MAG: DUF6671 family protein [Thiobacillus sp.]